MFSIMKIFTMLALVLGTATSYLVVPKVPCQLIKQSLSLAPYYKPIVRSTGFRIRAEEDDYLFKSNRKITRDGEGDYFESEVSINFN